jgi:hypothetical protein
MKTLREFPDAHSNTDEQHLFINVTNPCGAVARWAICREMLRMNGHSKSNVVVVTFISRRSTPLQNGTKINRVRMKSASSEHNNRMLVCKMVCSSVHACTIA